ncbi:MAG: TetR/AcrR family transcriptional regulator [Ignavibacteria bacterium]|nr:TetR/AcrR family transcriptional regulator [Ignavibacteria bacterium]MBT8381862.1 TetR/AcrR family transcriptional regulator [Ignavibacteria bacterium]MBT8393202.1 TetR/AcrR family transcriptional regulator [Ignavibacteria bacterium]NNL21826.1 TetR/AcrR family transcriptional regulator [Ignavibacteriaceae bacterium]
MNKRKPNTETNLEKQKILNYATEKFMSEGFYKTSMDSLASELQMSKKTIYKYFSSKDELVEIVVLSFMNEVKNRIDLVIKEEDNSLVRALHLFEVMRDVTTKFSDKWVKDIRLHLPNLWKIIDEFRTKRAYAVLGSIIQQGQKEGIIIEKPVELIIHLYVSAMRSIVNPDFLIYQKMNYKEAIQHTFEILFNGILTPAGKKQFKKSFKKVLK